MATYTVAQIKDRTSVPAVSVWSDDKILLYQSTAETLLDAMQLDSTVSGYTTAYNNAVIFLFDMLAENPTGLRSDSKGKVSRNFEYDKLPFLLRQMLEPYRKGTGSGIMGTQFQRRDIGLR